jgi:hypothetical protein
MGRRGVGRSREWGVGRNVERGLTGVGGWGVVGG